VISIGLARCHAGGDSTQHGDADLRPPRAGLRFSTSWSTENTLTGLSPACTVRFSIPKFAERGLALNTATLKAGLP
jgi:hypothetical protein